MRFETSAEVRKFLKSKGFTDFRVRWGNSPFGGEGKWIVKFTNIPKGTCLIHSSGSQQESKTYGDEAAQPWVKRIAELREALKGSNTIIDH